MKDKELVLEINGREYTVVVNEFSAREATVSVDGKKYKVGLKDLGAEQAAAVKPHAPVVKTQAVTVGHGGGKPLHRPEALAKANTILAPLPGQIIDIFVQEGETIKAGQRVCMLEAMKMENEVNASVGGIVVDIRKKVGQSVNQGDALFILKPVEG